MPAVSRAERERQERLLAEGLKRCCTCKETKPTEEFGAHASTRDGLQKQCDGCRNRSYRKEAPQAKARAAAWARSNPERRRVIAVAHAMMERARKLGLLPAHVADSPDERAKIQAVYTEAQRLTSETGIPHEVDHIRPLAAGGLHEIANLRVVTRAENQRKGATYQGADYNPRSKRSSCHES